MKVKTSELQGAALDWAVAKCEGYTDLHRIRNREPHEPQFGMWPPRREYGEMDLSELNYSSSWEQGGPIIEREFVCVSAPMHPSTAPWIATLTCEDKKFGGVECFEEQGPTPLIAAMRCCVASKLGDEVEIPEELK